MRIKHNDLTHYFMADHKDLPRAYLRKCEKFFQSIQDRLITKKDAAFLFKHQAPSLKHTNLKEKYASLEPSNANQYDGEVTQLIRIANAIEEILRLVKKDMEPSAKKRSS